MVSTLALSVFESENLRLLCIEKASGEEKEITLS